MKATINIQRNELMPLAFFLITLILMVWAGYIVLRGFAEEPYIAKGFCINKTGIYNTSLLDIDLFDYCIALNCSSYDNPCMIPAEALS